MTDRSCGECDACCVVLRIEDLNKEMYVPCSNIVRDSCGSCSIYDTRPGACRSFRCMWIDNELFFPDDFRPDKIGVMFYGELDKETNKPHVVAVEYEAGAINNYRVQEKINKLVKSFSIELIRKDIYKKKLPLAEEN